MKVPLVDLRAAFEPIRDQVMRGFDASLEQMQLFLGPNVTAFEREFASFCECRHGIGVSSGTDALVCALKACGVGAGDEVIVPSLTFFATIEAVIHVGATPVFVDVEPERLSLNVDEISAALSPATAAIVPVHLYGFPADMDPILEIAGDLDLRVIEDAAQAHGARYKGRRCGSIGDVACFSFYFTKNLGAVGEGGFVATSKPEIAEHARLLRDHGHTSKYEHALVGYNFRLDELQAVVLRAKLERLEDGNLRRNAIAQIYRSRLDLPEITHLAPHDDFESAYHLYPIRVRERDALRAHLERAGIGSGIHYPVPAQRQPALQAHTHRAGDMPVAEAACKELLSIPIYPELSEEQLAAVIDAVTSFFEP